MERLLIRVPLLLVEWLNLIGSGATYIIPWLGHLCPDHKRAAPNVKPRSSERFFLQR